MSKKYYVYELIDPRDDEVRYVGRSVNPAKRLAEHFKENLEERRQWIIKYPDEKTEKFLWLYELQLAGAEPVLKIIDVCGYDESKELEKLRIRFYRDRNHYLTNGTQYKSQYEMGPLQKKYTNQPRGSYLMHAIWNVENAIASLEENNQGSALAFLKLVLLDLDQVN